MSRSGLCRECGPIVQAEALEQLAHRHGPHYRAYLEGLTAAVARLWGETLAPDTLADVIDHDAQQEVERWLAGLHA